MSKLARSPGQELGLPRIFFRRNGSAAERKRSLASPRPLKIRNGILRGSCKFTRQLSMPRAASGLPVQKALAVFFAKLDLEKGKHIVEDL